MAGSSTIVPCGTRQAVYRSLCNPHQTPVQINKHDIQRKRVCMTVMCGGPLRSHRFLHSSRPGGRYGGFTEEDSYLDPLPVSSEFMHSFDFIRAQPVPGWVETKPEHLVDATLAKPGSDYIAYLADGRELCDPTAAQPVCGPIAFGLPEATYGVYFYSSTAGVYSRRVRVRGGDRITLEIRSFEQDIVLRATRER
jgi:hypothetical protein